MQEHTLVEDGNQPCDGCVPVDGEPPSEPPTEPPSETDGRDALDRLERRLDEALRLAARRDELVERLHRENQQLRQGELQAAMLPLLRDLMRVHDDLDRMIDLDERSRDTELIRDALSDTLARNGITRFSPEPGEPFDSARHAAVGTRATSDRLAERTICSVRRPGFQRDDGSIVRVAEVTVWSCRPAADPPPAEHSGERAAVDGDQQDVKDERG